MVTTPTRKQERKEKIPKIVATFVYASSQGQRTHTARTNFLSVIYISLENRMKGSDLSKHLDIQEVFNIKIN
jgi:hypothetical protein